MGKTKTAVLSGAPEEKLTGKAAYEAKKRKQEAHKKALDEKGKGAVGGVGLKGGERIKVISGGPDVDIEVDEKDSGVATSTTRRGPRVRGKKYNSAITKLDRTKFYAIKDAIKLVKETSFSKFDGSIELHVTIKKEKFNANVDLPHSAGKSKKVEVATDKTIEKLKKGKVDFDVLLATPDMMPKLVAFAKLLGPRGLMPNPKTGTLIKDKKDAKKFSGNTIQIKTERKAPVIHVVVGKVSQKDSELKANIEAIIKILGPKQALKASICATMSPGVKLSLK